MLFIYDRHDHFGDGYAVIRVDLGSWRPVGNREGIVAEDEQSLPCTVLVNHDLVP